MRSRNVAAALGVGLTIVGIGLVGYGMVVTGASDCGPDGCSNDTSALTIPLGIVLMVVGMIVGSASLASLRDERLGSSPLRAFGFMTGMGGVFLALGVIFLLANGAAGGSGDGTFAFLGLLFGVMGLCFIAVDLARFRGQLRLERLRVSGVRGTAKVLDLHDTNVTVNNSPMVRLDLDVTLPGQPTFRASRRTLVSRLGYGAFLSGATLTVLADPGKPRNFVVDWDAASASSGADPDLADLEALEAAAGHPRPDTDAAALERQVTAMLTAAGAPGAGAAAGPTQSLATGVAGVASAGGASNAVMPPAAPSLAGSAGQAPTNLPARVSLETIHDTGVDLPDGRLYAFDLTVSVAGRQPYRTKLASAVPPALVPRLTIGASFPADVDPSAPGQIGVHWDR